MDVKGLTVYYYDNINQIVINHVDQMLVCVSCPTIEKSKINHICMCMISAILIFMF